VKRALLLVDHGSRRADANARLEELAASLRAAAPDRFVAIAHLELAAPDIAAGVDACAAAGAEEVVVLPCFLAPGRHAGEDVPREVTSAARRHAGLRVRMAPALGDHPGLVRLLLELADEAGDGGAGA
jgi:sirohydrochlorin ferrochelatase